MLTEQEIEKVLNHALSNSGDWRTQPFISPSHIELIDDLLKEAKQVIKRHIAPGTELDIMVGKGFNGIVYFTVKFL